MIRANSPALVGFIAALELSLSTPQYRPVLNVVESLMVGEGVKTLSGLCRWCVSEPDPKAVADPFRESPWPAEPVRQALKRFLVKTAFQLAQARGLEHRVDFSIDDRVAEKHTATKHLEGVDWQHDHRESTRKRPVYQKGLRFVLCRLQVGPFSFPSDLRLQVREDTVRRLNRQRPKHGG